MRYRAAGDYIDIGTPFATGCAGDGEITRISFLEERLMKPKDHIVRQCLSVKDVKEVLLKPTNCVRGCRGCRAKPAGARSGKNR